MASKIFDISDALRLCRRRLPRLIFDFIDGGAGDERVVGLNVENLDAIRLLPRTLVDISDRKLERNLFGQQWRLPFGIAPMGMCNLTWPEADLLLARAAARYGIPLVLSTMASSSIEKTAERAGENAWFQLYVGDSEEVAYQLVQRAEAAAYRHLVLTVDVPSIGYRARERRNGFQSPLRIGPRQLVDFATHPAWSLGTLRTGIPRLANVNVPGGARFKRDEARGKIDWDFLVRLRERWPGKLIVKGVLGVDDALRVRDSGADAVYVSNHGGRQFDGVPAAIVALPRIRQAVGPDFPLLFDSGVRNGDAVIKAYALGADFVFVGRPFLYALGAEGAGGPSALVELFRTQIDIGLAQLGCPDINDIDAGYLYDEPFRV